MLRNQVASQDCQRLDLSSVFEERDGRTVSNSFIRLVEFDQYTQSPVRNRTLGLLPENVYNSYISMFYKVYVTLFITYLGI